MKDNTLRHLKRMVPILIQKVSHLNYENNNKVLLLVIFLKK